MFSPTSVLKFLIGVDLHINKYLPISEQCVLPLKQTNKNNYAIRLFFVTYKIFLINLREYHLFTIISINNYCVIALSKTAAYVQEEGRSTKLIKIYLSFKEPKI